jgi:CRISPR-associated protein Cmr4
MMNDPLLCGVFTLTPTHCGTGQAAGAVDLPIAREVHTGLPVLPASSIKGVVRELVTLSASGENEDEVRRLFGPLIRLRTQENDTSESEQSLQAGDLVFLEGTLLAFPVRSLTGVFRWVTAPLLIDRLRRLMQALGAPLPEGFTAPAPEDGDEGVVLPEGKAGPVSLEDLVFVEKRCRSDQRVGQLAEFLSAFVASSGSTDAAAFGERLVVVTNEVLQDLTRRATAVNARIVLDRESKTSDNLWYEETLPPDTLFAVVVAGRPGAGRSEGGTPVARLTRLLQERSVDGGRVHYTQIGGNVTVGQGLVRWVTGVRLEGSKR